MKTSQKLPGYPVRDMNIDELIIHYEPVITRAQLKAAVRRLEAYGVELLERDGPQAVRALIERTHLIAGNRRVKVLEVQLNRRRS